ncbi:uncharacterized protein C8Q71DRAFT_732740 [Rhodofomes roseus]|uniref:F-box domain-containing protein n=1 Tax=Rhodofomes roseus TaxID=34475 RepID=A0ABQ8KTP4_9APHY|nr:uncharacterized protein C8Q71DRAFT_732740 [Rhodofomes roseus]KAH9842406.1 hypothetical protein C8Q71DRAFT_732740 [Rhodofomes roseus]
MKHHRALDVHDIVWSILQHFGRVRSGTLPYSCSVDVGKDWRALVHCSLVSRAFSRPAIHLLWRELPSLLPLLSLCLHLNKAESFSVVGAFDTRCEETLWRSNSAPTQRGLERFAHFATFVEYISILRREHIDPTILILLSQTNPDQPLLPMLREIRCQGTVSPFLDTTVTHLLGPRLCTLLIYGNQYPMLGAVKTHETYAIRHILRELPSKAPHLQELYIYQHAARDASRMMSIVQLHDLRTLRIWCQSEAREQWFGPFMSRLAKLEHLRDHELPLGHWIADTLPTAIGGFPQLRKLRLDGESRQDMLCLRPLARGMPPLRLERLEVVNTVVNSFADDYGALEDLTSACADALAIVILGLEPGRDALGRRGPMPVFNFLRPLVQLRLLQFCDISYSRSLTITDDDLRKVRGAWPLLKAFVLSWSRPYKASTVPSFRGIVDFLQEAPHLMELRLQAITMDGEVARCVKVNTLPSNLMVEDEHIHDPAAFARILRTLFPNVRVREGALENALSSKWSIVMSRLRENPTYTHLVYRVSDDVIANYTQ